MTPGPYRRKKKSNLSHALLSLVIFTLIKSVIYPRVIYNTPKSIQASVTILENLHLIIEKTKPEDVTTDIMPMLFYSFDGSTIQVQVSAAPLGYANHFGTGKWKWV